jgi:transposase-like protein
MYPRDMATSDGPIADQADLLWFAGIFDGDGHCGLRMNKSREANATVTMQFGLSDYRTVNIARQMVENWLGCRELTVHRRENGSWLTDRPYWHISVVAKEDAYRLGRMIVPYLRVKRLEVELALSYLSRSLSMRKTGGHHEATALDRRMCELSSAIKTGDAAAEAEAERLVREHPPVYEDADIDDPRIAEWRRYYEFGGAIGAIARHYGVTHYIVQRAVRGLQQERSVSARELGLVPRPRIPSHVPPEEAEAWRAAVGAGEAARAVARRFGRHPQTVVEATCDIRFQSSEFY